MGKVIFNLILPTKTKLFCGCPIPDMNEDGVYDKEVIDCPVCRGEKGAYPILNKKAVELAVAAVLALKGKVTQYTLFDRVRGESGLYDRLSQYSHPIGTDGYVEWTNETEDSKEEDSPVTRIEIPVMRLKEWEEEKGIPVLEITSGSIEEEQNTYYIEAMEEILTGLGMEEWEIIETDELIESMENQIPLSFLPDPDIPPIIISQWWTNQIGAMYPDLISIEEPEIEEDDF